MHEVPPVPMDYAGADMQGAHRLHVPQGAAQRISQARGMRPEGCGRGDADLVDRNDPAFANPTKPIGSHMDEADGASGLPPDKAGPCKEDAGRGWRRVVPSPMPQTIVELEVIRRLAKAGYRGHRLRRRRHPGRRG